MCVCMYVCIYIYLSLSFSVSLSAYIYNVHIMTLRHTEEPRKEPPGGPFRDEPWSGVRCPPVSGSKD